MMMSLLSVAVLFSCLHVITSKAPSFELREMVRRSEGGGRVAGVEEGPVACKRNQLCRWAVCPWSQWFMISAQNCQFVESTCQCPSSMECVRTNAMRPGSDFIVFKYRCQ